MTLLVSGSLCDIFGIVISGNSSKQVTKIEREFEQASYCNFYGYAPNFGNPALGKYWTEHMLGYFI